METSNCNSDALWVQSSLLAIDGMVAEDTIRMSGVEGEIHDLVGTDVVVNNVDGFMMSGLTLESISGSDNREVNIHDATITGAPAIDLDNTAGELSNLAIDCGGSGTGLTAHHGRALHPRLPYPTLQLHLMRKESIYTRMANPLQWF